MMEDSVIGQNLFDNHEEHDDDQPWRVKVLQTSKYLAEGD